MCVSLWNERTGTGPLQRGKIARLKDQRIQKRLVAAVVAIIMSRGCISSALQSHPFSFATISNMTC